MNWICVIFDGYVWSARVIFVRDSSSARFAVYLCYMCIALVNVDSAKSFTQQPRLYKMPLFEQLNTFWGLNRLKARR